MFQNNEVHRKVVLLGLPPSIAESLGQILSNWGVMLYIPPETPAAHTLNLIKAATPDLIFVWTGDNLGTSLLKIVRSSFLSIPAIAVNRRVKSSEVLDALDSGAADYCSPPFDATHIQRLLSSVDRSDDLADVVVS